VISLSKTCPGSLSSLSGYSKSGWIINLRELQYPAEAANIYSAGLIGDPCRTDATGWHPSEAAPERTICAKELTRAYCPDRHSNSAMGDQRRVPASRDMTARAGQA
jgi:hypothetical protein